MHNTQKRGKLRGHKIGELRESGGKTLDTDREVSETSVQRTAETRSQSLQSLQAKVQQLRAKLHKEVRWYCDTILQGGALAVRVAYRVHCAVETIEMVDHGAVREDPALGSYCVLIGGSLYSEEELDRLLDTEYLLDDLYDTWCGMTHTDEEWSDTVDRYLNTVEGRYPNNK